MTVANLNLMNQQQRLFWRVSFLTAGLLLGYLYLVNSVVFNVVTRQKALEQLASKQTAVVALEAEYLGLSNAVTLELAHQLGFRDASSQTIFAFNSSATL